jgi:hypothetical protein
MEQTDRKNSFCLGCIGDAIRVKRRVRNICPILVLPIQSSMKPCPLEAIHDCEYQGTAAVGYESYLSNYAVSQDGTSQAMCNMKECTVPVNPNVIIV